MRSFYDFARHDFADICLWNRERQLETLSSKSFIIGAQG
jgi:hypothetical protein